MKRSIVILLALVLLLSLTACEDAVSKLLYKNDRNDSPNNVQAQEPSIPNTTPSDGDVSTAPVEPDGPAEPVEPSVSQPSPDNTAEPAEKDEPQPSPDVMVSHTDVSLFSAGESFRFTVWNSSGNAPDACTYTSADPAIAAVDETGGEITAVAPGITTITAHVEFNGEKRDFDCIVRCRWSEEEPSLPDAEPDGTPVSGPSLSDFFADLQGRYEGLDAMMVMDAQLLDSYYPGLTGIAAVEEVLVQETMRSTANVAIGLVRLSDSAAIEDVLAVQSVFQNRIDTQAEGGAFYPASCETWENGVTTSVSGYVGMFVYPDGSASMASLFTDTFSN